MRDFKAIGTAVMGLCALGTVALGGTQPEAFGSDPCQILDAVVDPVYEVGATFFPQSRFHGYGKSAFVEMDARWDVAYFRDILLGDLDFSLDADTLLLTDSAGLQLPHQLAWLATDVGLTWRYVGGAALQARVRPGIYSDLEETSMDAVFMPASWTLIQSFNPFLSAMLGIEVRPSFVTKIMPRVGAAWQPTDFLRAEVGVPKSRLSYVFNPEWSSRIAFEWRNVSYAVRARDDYDREMVELEDFRLSWGVTKRLSDLLQVTGEIGRITNRHVEFKREVDGLDSEVTIGDALYLRLALGGPF